MERVAIERSAYTAGAIDGEGWIGLQRGSPEARGVRSPRFAFGLTITNTNKQWLETLQSWFGGTIHRIEAAGHRNRRACYILRFRSAEVRNVLAAVMPYLLVKRRQAELLMEFFPLAYQRRAMNLPPHQPRDSDPIVLKQQAIYEELRRLNQRGHKAVNYEFPRETRLCSLDGCERKHYGHGYCWIHYRKFIVRGGPTLHERQCQGCSKPFVARRSDAAFCSKECAGKAYYRANAERIKAQVKDYKRRTSPVKS